MISAILTPAQGLDAGWAILACCAVVTLILALPELRRKRNAKRRQLPTPISVTNGDHRFLVVGMTLLVDDERMRIVEIREDGQIFVERL
ncbi:MAG TPA: hypothetical protein VG246_13145 [Acidimicrobiales bacterium]|nr:hypothetical protein [Acidimicrobiales bacterium]